MFLATQRLVARNTLEKIGILPRPPSEEISEYVRMKIGAVIDGVTAQLNANKQVENSENFQELNDYKKDRAVAIFLVTQAAFMADEYHLTVTEMLGEKKIETLLGALIQNYKDRARLDTINPSFYSQRLSEDLKYIRTLTGYKPKISRKLIRALHLN